MSGKASRALKPVHGRRRAIAPVRLIASVGLAVALLTLSGVAAWAAFETSSAAGPSHAARVLAEAYGVARFGGGAGGRVTGVEARSGRLVPGVEPEEAAWVGAARANIDLPNRLPERRANRTPNRGRDRNSRRASV